MICWKYWLKIWRLLTHPIVRPALARIYLSVHAHSIAMDGVFSVSGPTPLFYQLRGPTDEEVGDIVAALAQDVIAALREKNYLSEDATEIDRPESLDKCFAESEQLSAAATASTKMMIAFGERAGQKVRRKSWAEGSPYRPRFRL